MISLEISNKLEVERKLNQLAKNLVSNNVKTQMDKVVREMAFLGERGIKLALTSGWTRAIKTGLLRASVRVNSFGNNQARVGPNVKYASMVHYGTYKMRARPFIPVGWSMVSGDVNRLAELAGVNISTKIINGV